MPSALFVTTVASTLEAFLLPLAERLRGAGWRVDALASGAADEARIAGFFDERFDIAWSRDPLDPANLVGRGRDVRGIVRAGGYDVVHVHTPIAAFVTRRALSRLPRAGRPAVIYTAHGFHFYRGQRAAPHALYRTMERAAGRWTDYLVTMNAEDAEAARALGTIAADRIRLIPGVGVDADRYDPASLDPAAAPAIRRELALADDAFVLLMVAEFSGVKRHLHLLDALSRVRDPRVMAVFVGAGPLEDRVRERTEALGLGPRVRFAGLRRDVPALLAAADALALVSEREGLPRSVLEGMAAGLPVIGTLTRGIVDAVGAEAGWLVPRDDAAALADAIDAAAADPGERTVRGAAGRERVRGMFALPLVLDAYEELYREALASRV